MTIFHMTPEQIKERHFVVGQITEIAIPRPDGTAIIGYRIFNGSDFVPIDHPSTDKVFDLLEYSEEVRRAKREVYRDAI